MKLADYENSLYTTTVLTTTDVVGMDTTTQILDLVTTTEVDGVDSTTEEAATTTEEATTEAAAEATTTEEDSNNKGTYRNIYRNRKNTYITIDTYIESYRI